MTSEDSKTVSPMCSHDDIKTVHLQSITADAALLVADYPFLEVGPVEIVMRALAAEVRRLRGEAVLLNDLVKDRDERALDDARAEVAEGCIALEGVCRDLLVKLSDSEAVVDRLREEREHLLVCARAADEMETKLARVESLPAMWRKEDEESAAHGCADEVEAALRDA